MSAHRWPEYAQTLPEVLAGLRSELEIWLLCHPLSVKQLGRQIGVNRRTLGRWLAGEENVSVRTLLRIATWLRETPLRPPRTETRNGCATLVDETGQRARGSAPRGGRP